MHSGDHMSRRGRGLRITSNYPDRTDLSKCYVRILAHPNMSGKYDFRFIKKFYNLDSTIWMIIHNFSCLFHYLRIVYFHENMKNVDFSHNLHWRLSGEGKLLCLQLGITTYRNGPERTKRTWTDRNGPERTETDLDRNGLLWVPKRTGMDFSGYRNGPEQTSAHTETNFNGNQKR